MEKTKSIALILGVLAMSILVGYIVLVWTEPTTTPPGDNVPVPLNVGNVAQNVTKRIFITSTTHTGNLGGLAGADNICMARAREAGLPGTWRALLSTTGMNARDRIHYNWARLETMDGRVIALSKDDLWKGSIRAPIKTTETGATLAGAMVWTGTLADGTHLGSCENWTMGEDRGFGLSGKTNRTDDRWIENIGTGCAPGHHLYCVEQ